MVAQGFGNSVEGIDADNYKNGDAGSVMTARHGSVVSPIFRLEDFRFSTSARKPICDRVRHGFFYFANPFLGARMSAC